MEFQALASEIDCIAEDTEVAGTKLLDGLTSSVNFKFGTGTDPSADELIVGLSATTTSVLRLAALTY